MIEIATGNDAGLGWALPKSQAMVKKLRQHYKDLPIVIVTHGREQFAVTKKKQSSHQVEHSAAFSLLQDSKVQVHVCGTHAARRGLSDEDFPGYVNVSAEGAAQIKDYMALGYLLLVIRPGTPAAN